MIIIIIDKSNPFIFPLLTIILLLFLQGCGGQNTEVKTTTTQSYRELTAEESFALEQNRAMDGNVEAQRALGMMYYNGKGVPQDAAKAMEWFQKAAGQGYAAAQYNLGEMYYNENPFGDQPIDAVVRKDNTKAAEWYQKAAEQGFTEAQVKLGGMYFNGEGVPKNATKTVEWWEKAAAQEHAATQRNLGMMYREGLGVPKNPVKAKQWYQKAAEQGDAEAQYSLGRMYHGGRGVPKDSVKAVQWYQKAAMQGHPDAQAALGFLYLVGEGIPLDRVRAYAWLNLAAAQGYSVAADIRNSTEGEMTPAQVAEGQRLASSWKKGDTLQTTGRSFPGNTENAGMLIKHATGTAFVVSRDAHALTNQHVILGCKEVRVAGSDGIAKVITSDSVNDLALLQFPGKSIGVASLNPDPANLRQGEDVIVFGYPLNSMLSSGGNLTPGTLSALTGLGNNTNQIQITAPIQPGSSGSPVLDKKGNVIGVVSMKLDDGVAAKATGQIPQNVNFAVNGQTTKAFLDANKVPYKVGGGLFSREKNNADIAEDAKKWTVLVECWK